MNREQYIEAITKATKEAAIPLLDLIYKLLIKSAR